MRSNLWDDPRVTRLADMTDSSEAAVVGGLYWLWATADQHSTDGIMPGLSLRGVDRKTGIQGLGEALCAVGWLADHPGGVRVAKFEEHNGDSAKKRCQTAKRVANHKVANAEVTQPALANEQESVSTALPREREDIEKEKEIDKKKIKKEDSASLAPIGVSETVWEDFLKIRRAKKSPMTNTALAGIIREADKAGYSLEQALKTCCERGWVGFKAEWVADKTQNSSTSVQPLSFAERDELARRTKWEEMTGRRWPTSPANGIDVYDMETQTLEIAR